MSQSVVPEILNLLRPWLDERATQFNMQIGANVGQPTLPEIGGKVDLRAVLRGAGIKLGHEQHFYRKAELKLEVNAAAAAQGLLGIGSHGDSTESERVVSQRLSQAQRDKSDYARALTEAAVQLQQLRRENECLRSQLQLRTDTGMVIRR